MKSHRLEISNDFIDIFSFPPDVTFSYGMHICLYNNVCVRTNTTCEGSNVFLSGDFGWLVFPVQNYSAIHIVHRTQFRLCI